MSYPWVSPSVAATVAGVAAVAVKTAAVKASLASSVRHSSRKRDGKRATAHPTLSLPATQVARPKQSAPVPSRPPPFCKHTGRASKTSLQTSRDPFLPPALASVPPVPPKPNIAPDQSPPRAGTSPPPPWHPRTCAVSASSAPRSSTSVSTRPQTSPLQKRWACLVDALLGHVLGDLLDHLPLLVGALVRAKPLLGHLVELLLRVGAAGLEDLEEALLVR